MDAEVVLPFLLGYAFTYETEPFPVFFSVSSLFSLSMHPHESDL